MDKVNVGIFRIKTLFGSLDDLLSRPETSILDRLRVRTRGLLLGLCLRTA